MYVVRQKMAFLSVSMSGERSQVWRGRRGGGIVGEDVR